MNTASAGTWSMTPENMNGLLESFYRNEEALERDDNRGCDSAFDTGYCHDCKNTGYTMNGTERLIVVNGKTLMVAWDPAAPMNEEYKVICAFVSTEED